MQAGALLNARGRFYHIDCAPGDLAPYILTSGDPGRARRIARHFDRISVRRHNREFLTITGFYKNIPISVMATGIGAAPSAIAIVEAAQCVQPATFIRLGSTGALQAHIAIGDLIITSEARREENTTHYYAPPDVKAQAHPRVTAALERAAQELDAPYHVGVTCTAADFYAGQGRLVPGFPTLEADKVARLNGAGVLNLEMEMSAYLTLAAVSTYEIRAGGACAVFANRITGAAAFGQKNLRVIERRLILVGLRAVEILAGEDRK
jgi:uridine phosphorylase